VIAESDECCIAVLSSEHLVAGGRHVDADQLANVGFVINDEHACHRATPMRRRGPQSISDKSEYARTEHGGIADRYRQPSQVTTIS
jgi:hypothetical protein